MYQTFSPILDHELRTVHFIQSDSKHSWYPQVLALDGLLNRLNKRFYRQYLKKGKLRVRFAQKEKKASPLLGAVYDMYYTITKHEDVWEFFRFIGYDHKIRSVTEVDKYLINYNCISKDFGLDDYKNFHTQLLTEMKCTSTD